MASTQILLLIEEDAEPRPRRAKASSALKKYALLTKSLSSDRRVLESFQGNGFKVVIDGKGKFSRNERFELITAQVVRNATAGDNVLIAVDELHKDLVQRLFKNNVSVSLCTAAKRLSSDNSEIIKTFLTSGSKINYRSADGSTILHFLTEKGPGDVLELLLKQVDDINARRNDTATALHIAIDWNSMRKVALLLENGADVNAKMADGSTPLILAVNGGCLNIVKLLIAEGANVNAEKNDGSAPLRLAFEGRDTDKIIEVLILNGANADFILEDGSTPLILAVEKDSLKIAELLIAKGANVNAEKKDGSTPLRLAFKGGSNKMMDLLITNGANVDFLLEDGSTPLILAVEKNHLKTVELLTAKGVNVNGETKDGSTSLHIAAREGYTKIVKCLLGYDVNIDSQSNWSNFKSSTPLHVAALNGYYQIVALLLAKGANVNSEMEDGTTALHIATRKGYTKTVKVLLRYNVNVDSQSNWRHFGSSTPLHVAVILGYHEIVALLLKKGADLNAECSDGRTPLHLAVSECHLKVCEILVKFSPDVNSAKNKEAFKFALSKLDKGYREVALVLLDGGFDVTVEDAGNPDLLFRAIAQNVHQIVEKLLTLGASPNWRHNGEMPLHKAAACADEDMIRLLLDHGANINAFIFGNTPLSKAIRASNGETARALIANNANVKEPLELLHLAVKHCSDPELVELLLLNGVDVNANSNGKTPVTVAVEQDEPEIFEMLVKFGASCGVRHLNSRCVTGSLEAFKEFLNYDFTNFACANVDKEIRDFFSHFHYLYDCQSKKEALIIVLLKMAVAYESDRFEALLPTHRRNNLESGDLKKKYTAEMAEMKVKNIGLSSITFFDILTKNTSQISQFLRNGSVSQILKDFDVSAAYPNYGPIIECQFRKGTWRRESLDKGIQLFGLLFSEFSGLPGDLKEDMVDYLSNQEILILQNVLESKRLNQANA